MPCSLTVDRDAKRDALDIVADNPEAWQQINDLLLALPGDPRPVGCTRLDDTSFFVRLPCGVFIAWEIMGDMLKLATEGCSPDILVRVGLISRAKPKRLPKKR